MPDERDLEPTTLPQRLVLLGVVRRTVGDGGPPNSAEVRQACGELLDVVPDDVVGGLSEADVMRRLYELEGERVLKQVAVENRSPTGKGRPRYDLTVDADAVLDTFEDDERIAPAVERIRAEVE